MKFNNANVILFLFASAKTTHVNGTSLRKSHVKGSDEEKTYGESMDAVRSMKKIGRTPTDSIVHYADAGSAKLRGGNDARTTNHGSGTTSSFAASVVKELDGSSTTDRNVLHHADAGSAKFGKVTDIRSVHHISITLQKSSAGESSSTTEPLRKLSSVTFDNYNNEIGQARFHEIASLTGDSVLIDLSLGRRTVCNNDGSVVVTAGILLLETNDEGDDTFKYVVKIFGDGSSDELNLSLVHTITEEGEGSIFDSDAYVELALSGDGKTLAIANTKAYRGLDHTRGDSTVKIFKLVDNSWSSSVTIVFSDNAGGGGFYFGGLQVSLSDDGLKLLLGLPYVDDNLDGATVPNVGNVQIYDLTSDSPSTPTFDLAAMEELYSNVNTEGAYIGRKVAISGDGSSIVFSAPGDNKVYWFQVGSPSTLETFSGEQEDTDMGSSLAITYDGKIFAYGARNHDDTDNDAPDKGIVTVQKYIDSEDTWQRLGQVLMGERGEGINGDSYYVGDNFGYDIALSEKDAYDSNQASYVIRLLVGSPKNDVTGLGDEYYYHGQGELFQINYKDATINTPWEQVAYDVDGQTSGEKSGTSVAMSANGDTIIIGAPGYGPSSKGGYFKGIVRVYKQTEYSSVPSSVPSDIPSVTSQPSNLPSVSSKPSSIPSLSLVPSETPSISAKPSNMPSVTSKPSNLPSVSLQPSSIPSLSLVPSETPSVSVLPSVVPSVSSEPSSPPSAVVDKEFQLISTFGKFVEDTKKDWCLTAFENAKLHVRPCRSYDSRSKNMQIRHLW